MDITAFVVAQRDGALLLGDYNTYRQTCSRRILTLRKRTGRATPKNAKFTQKAPVTAADIAKSHDSSFIHLLVFTAERAWAHAMHMKATHAEDNADKGITGSTRKHIISRLHKAAQTAKELASLLADPSTNATDVDLLEAQAYVYSLSGAEEFEKQAEGIHSDSTQPPDQRWKQCLLSYAAARVIYNALLQATTKDLFKEFLAGTIDPSIRYAAYQSRLPRTVTVAAVALQFFPKDDAALVSAVEKLYPDALKDEASATGKDANSAEKIPNTITWRSRTANIVDAGVGQALAAVTSAEARLSDFLASATPETSSRDKAAAYDDVLIASQDASDSTRHAIEELEKEGVSEGDSRMQDLRVTDLAVNYALIGWRVGRNRVLIGSHDGAVLDAEGIKKPKKARRDGQEWVEKEEGTGRKLARIRERNVLYDSILQSIDSVKDLRGAMRDAGFIEELDGKRAYYRALKCLNLGYSHALLSQSKNALALFARALELTAKAVATSTSASSPGPPKLDVSREQAEFLHNRVQGLSSQYRALVDLHNHVTDNRSASKGNVSAPVVERLNEYPAEGVDLRNLVQWPPKLQPVPIKPLFLDVAFNYIDYPGRAKAAVENGGGVRLDEAPPTAEEPKKKGWFGFGR
ncbi:putative signal recognition protein [Neofusicoccum parvum UCRNP2]|uniref:Signal recognition particle subunit SRP68 n=1 Tax=Botryosphaeria parva (strain UCR-NP2) TaxID=1287680 RepID=R1GIX0_BOTPV|nr:putative signal recognition protein [Neofusicoccum parvum UCRNP2]